MSIDYDRIRELLEQWQHGDEVRDQLEAQWDMELAAPDMARELLRLRDEVEKLREMCLLERDAAFQETPMRAGEVGAFNVCADQLTGLLNGDTE